MDQLTIQALLSAALPSISKTTTPENTYQTKKRKLLSQDPPVSIPLLSIAFRRFIVKVSPIIYVQDRVEEVLLWKRGNRVGLMWAAVWGLLCYYPRLFLVLPHIILIGTILNRTLHPPPPPSQGASSGEQDWQSNLQGIQNLMLFYASAYDAVVSSPVARAFGPLRSPASKQEVPGDGSRPSSPAIEKKSAGLDAEQESSADESQDGRMVSALPLLVLTLPLPILISYAVPIRLLLVFAGWLPLALGHPYVQSLLLLLLGHNEEGHLDGAVVKDATSHVHVLGKDTSRRAELAALVLQLRDSEVLRRLREDKRLQGIFEELVKVEVREEDLRKEVGSDEEAVKPKS